MWGVGCGVGVNVGCGSLVWGVEVWCGVWEFGVGAGVGGEGDPQWGDGAKCPRGCGVRRYVGSFLEHFTSVLSLTPVVCDDV